MNAIIYDTETTGVDPDKDCVIQHAMLAVDFDGEELVTIGEAHSRLFSSPVPISYGAMAVHRLTEDTIAGHGYFDRTQHTPACTFLIGHNVDFDWKMIGMPLAHKRICTLAIARACYPEASSHTLAATYLMQAKGSAAALSYLADAHDAGVDVILTFRILRHMVAEFCPSLRTLADLHKWSEECRVPKIWTFGKWKGKRIEEADRGYLNWYLRLPENESDPYTAKACRMALGIR